MALPGRQREETLKKAHTVTDKTLWDIMLSTLTGTCTHFLLIQPVSLANMYDNYFINVYQKRQFPLSRTPN